jgi:hypothetical protein
MRADRRTDGRTDMMKVIFSFRKLSNSSLQVTVKHAFCPSSYRESKLLLHLILASRCTRAVTSLCYARRASSNVCISCLLTPQKMFLKRQLIKSSKFKLYVQTYTLDNFSLFLSLWVIYRWHLFRYGFAAVPTLHAM